MRVYCCQLDTAWENPSANHARVRALLDAALPEPESLVVLPEMFATGFSMNVAKIAADDSAQTMQFLSTTARDLCICLIGGLVIRAADGRGLNQAVAFDPSGREIARYSKLHPFTFAGESAHYAPGEAIVTFNLNPFTVAPFICYDLRFPEAFRSAVRRGADLFPIIANWPAARESHWVALLRARAIENQAYVVGVNRSGKDPTNSYSGRSLIIDPRGDVLAEAGSGETVLHADLDWENLRAYRASFPVLRDARKEFRAAGE